MQDSAAQGMVVLKNEGEVLPIPRDPSVALIGHHAFYPFLGGGGSARVDSIRAGSLADGLKAAGFRTTECPSDIGRPYLNYQRVSSGEASKCMDNARSSY